MTNPQGPPPQDPAVWSRAAGQEPVHPAAPPTGPPTFEDTPPPVNPPLNPPVKTRLRILRDPLSVALVAVIAVALALGGMIGAELYARHRADGVVAAAVECVVHDKVSVSFGPTPFLLQHLRGDYSDISVRTAGNQIRSLKGMQADITINNVDLHGDADSKGTIGELDAAITWTSAGIKETVADAVPFVGGLVNSVTTNPAAGTLELKGALGLGTVTVKPQVADKELTLQVVQVTAMGAVVPHETAQAALDVFTSRLVNDYPLGIHADSVQVTNAGVSAHFSTRNASIPASPTDPCFAGL
ncbi:DUF2993 domain-containing protein [Mycobacterium sp.]|uniref:LmeA family phospholipid-binding protein n=1 Tax=Mycobacterium sp. TaxID=1785 RepID=UPI0031D4DB51